MCNGKPDTDTPLDTLQTPLETPQPETSHNRLSSQSSWDSHCLSAAWHAEAQQREQWEATVRPSMWTVSMRVCDYESLPPGSGV